MKILIITLSLLATSILCAKTDAHWEHTKDAQWFVLTQPQSR